MMGPMQRSAIAFFVFACVSASIAFAQAPTNAADEYNRLGQQFLDLESSEVDLWGVPDGQSLSDFMESGTVDARMQRWLDRARPMVGEFIRSAALPYNLPLDKSQGFRLPLPHYSRQRAIARAFDLMLIDAERNDRTKLAPLLHAQSVMGANAASDGLIVSSLIAMSYGDKTRLKLADMIDRGEVDAALAREALTATTPIAGKESLRLHDALESERAILLLEVSRLRDADPTQRAALDDEFGAAFGGEPINLDEATLEKFPAQAEAFHAASRAALDAPTAEAAAAAMKVVDETVESGGYGELVKKLAPAMDPMLERVWKYDHAWKSLTADLTALANGTLQPEDLTDAAKYYLRASNAARQLRVGEQAEIDALRLAADELASDLRVAGAKKLGRMETSITAEVLAGSRLGRLRLDDASLMYGKMPAGIGLVWTTQPGINGAVRVMLASALTEAATEATTSPRAKPLAQPHELAVAAVRVAAHYASTGRLAHSLAARAMLLDAADAITQLRATGHFELEARAMLLKALARLDANDPLGLLRAIEAERAGQLRGAPSAGLVNFADEARVARLSADEIAFLVAANDLANPELAAKDCDCPDHGVLLDMRGWFDPIALAKLDLARAHLQARLAREQAKDAAKSASLLLPGSPLEGLEVTPPVVIDRVREDGVTVVARLRALSE